MGVDPCLEEFVGSNTRQGPDDPQVVIASDGMRRLMALVGRVASHKAAVLITGETGSGKEVIAKAIHQRSLRCNKPWVDINCAAFPENLIESELFGYDKGAFSGADRDKPGLFELAHTGTLFLDEVGDLEPRVQVKLLRVLDGATYYRLGGSKKISTDVRVIAATNRPLETLIETGGFRRDLYHRLGQFQLRVPPLRERPEDIDALARYFLAQFDPSKSLAYDAIALLHEYPWPGNVRELQNVIIQAAAFCTSDVIRAEEMVRFVRTGGDDAKSLPESSAAPSSIAVPDRNLTTMEKQAILAALARSGGHKGQTAEQLGISRRTLTRKLKQYEIADGRKEPAPVIGALSPELQYTFRCPLEVPILIRNSDSDEFRATSQNLSSGGMAVNGIPDLTHLRGMLQIEFTLPGGREKIHVIGQVVWANPSGTAGLRFTHAPESAQFEIAGWLKARQREEGWAV